jgi:hypothetical protein
VVTGMHVCSTKWTCHIYDRQNVEVHNAPQTVVLDGVKHHLLHKQDVFQCQQSLCDSHDESHDETHEHVRKRGKTDTQQVHGLYCYQDSDNSLSSEPKVTNGDTGMRYNVPDETYEHSECSDKLVNMSNDVHRSGMCPDSCVETLSDVDDEPNGLDSVLVMDEPTNNDMISSKDAVEFRCIQVYHHIAVSDDDEREFDDGEEPS